MVKNAFDENFTPQGRYIASSQSLYSRSKHPSFIEQLTVLNHASSTEPAENCTKHLHHCCANGGAGNVAA